VLAKNVFDSGERKALDELSGAGDRFWTAAIKAGEQAFETQNWSPAIANYIEALDLSPDHPFAYHITGLCHFALEDMASGIEAWQHVLDLEPNYDFSSIYMLSRRA
jgi:tetratricopeptide (TPR) repeat protein